MRKQTKLMKIEIGGDEDGNSFKGLESPKADNIDGKGLTFNVELDDSDASHQMSRQAKRIVVDRYSDRGKTMYPKIKPKR